MSIKRKHNRGMLIKDFSKFQGSIAEFCKMKEVSKSQFYKQRKERNMINISNNVEKNITFTKFELKKDNDILDRTNTIENKQNELSYEFEKKSLNKSNLINIQIGKVNIELDTEDKATLSFFIKEIYSLC